MKAYCFVLMLILVAGCQQELVKEDISCYTIRGCASEIRVKIQQNWLAPIDSQDLTAVVLLKINENNELIESKIVESSGRVDFDISVIEAIDRSSPFSELRFLTEKDREKFDEIQFSFALNW